MSLIVRIEKKLKNFLLKVDFETEGSCFGILGASGCGKSMTLKCIAGIETPTKGYIELNGKVLYDSKEGINLPPKQRKVGYLFQNYALFPNMTVWENIGIGMKESKEEKKKIIKEMIDTFKLHGLEDQYPAKLSGGQQQRVALARMLSVKPDVLLFDEPFSALDTYLKEELQLQFYDLLKRYQGESIMVTHSRDEVYRFCKNAMIIEEGSIIELGDTKQIFSKPKKAQTARLTGCKNIFPVEKISDYEVKAVDLEQVFTLDRKVEDSISYIGIRAHDFYIKKEEDTDNLIPCIIEKIGEAPFEWNIVLHPEKSSKNAHKVNKATESEYKKEGNKDTKRTEKISIKTETIDTVWWKISKSQLNSNFDTDISEGISQGSSLCLTVKPADILLLEE